MRIPALVIAATALLACLPGGEQENDDCDPALRLESRCPGVPAQAVCRSAPCTDGVTCATVHAIGPGDDLAATASSADDGDCIALSPGEYPAVTLPPGVSLLGPAASEVVIDGVEVEGGRTTLRGLTVSGTGVYVSGGDVAIDRVHVTGATGPGLHIVDADVTVSASTIDDNRGYGVAAACSGGCECAAMPSLTMTSVHLQANEEVGVWLHGVSAELRGVEVAQTGPRNFARGRGIEASACSDVTGSGIVIRDHPDVGLLLHRAGGSIGPDLRVTDNLRGVHVQSLNVDQGVIFDGFEISDNRAVGFGADDGATGIILQNGRVAHTSLAAVPVGLGQMDEIGDGVSWLRGSVLTIAASVEVASSGRVPVIIDSSTEGSFEGTLSGGDEAVGFILQNFDPQEADLAISDDVMTTHPDDPLSVAAPMDVLDAP